MLQIYRLSKLCKQGLEKAEKRTDLDHADTGNFFQGHQVFLVAGDQIVGFTH